MKIILFLIFSIITTFANAENIYSKPYIKSLLIENAKNSSYVSPALALAVARSNLITNLMQLAIKVQ